MSVTQQITAHEAAVLLLDEIESKGAIVTMNEDDLFFVDLNPIEGLTHQSAERLSLLVLSVREEIRSILKARRTLH